MDFSNTKKLTHIDLSYNEFNGFIPDSLLKLKELETLLLQENNLTGSIPSLNQLSLKDFNVSNNNLSGEIPETNVLQMFTISSYNGNPFLCGSPMPSSCKKTKLKLIAGSLWITIFVIVDILAFFVLLSLVCVCIKKKKIGKAFQGKNKNKKVDFEAVPAEDKEKKLKFMDSGGVIFELSDLLKASAEGLGKGNYGNSFKATLDNGLTVVVKRLTELKPLSSEEFATQMKLISGFKHRNLLPLLAYYYSKDEKLLLYKFIPKGNLYNRIHGGRGNNRIPFKWSSRLSVAHGVAKAMEFLHQNTKASQSVIPHGNLKSSNILLDENDIVLVSDYGLTSLIAFPVAAQKMISYKSPEYQNRRKITKKSDVWSYGCLLLELLTGQICTYTAPQGSNDGVDLCSWAYRAVREEWTCEIFDMEILTQRNAGQGMVRLLQLALKCCDKAPEKWPEMAEVAREVEDIKLNDDNDEFSFERSGSTDVSTSAV
ncbi:hypothetical protein MKW92_048078 [Papaver armeniacum]|nr:hypothetical protein MKW92_048078 [Papaver armeniacum]